MNKNIVLGAVAALVLGVGAFVLSSGGDQVAETAFAPANAQSTDAEIDTSSVRDMAIGAEDAPVTIIEYASFTCPHCRTFHENVYGDLKKDYVDTGKVKFVFREVYFDRYGLWAGMVARCGDGERYFGIVDLIFENQRDWTQGEPVQIAENLKKFGRVAGLDNETLEACMTDGEKAQALTAAYQQNAEADNIRATPSFVINGTTHSNMSYEEMKRIIDAAL
ncbi:MAG: DsbA family protein [Litoreibacter sp.]